MSLSKKYFYAPSTGKYGVVFEDEFRNTFVGEKTRTGFIGRFIFYPDKFSLNDLPEGKIHWVVGE